MFTGPGWCAVESQRSSEYGKKCLGYLLSAWQGGAATAPMEGVDPGSCTVVVSSWQGISSQVGRVSGWVIGKAPPGQGQMCGFWEAV